MRTTRRLRQLALVALIPVSLLVAAPAAQALPPAGRTQLITYLNGLSGRYTLAGQHNREPNADPARWTRIAQETTGQFPGLWGGDFLFSNDDVGNRQTMVNEAIRQWQAGSVVTLAWHVCPPTVGRTCGWDSAGILSRLSDSQWNQLVTNGSALNNAWKARLNEAVPFLRRLQDAGVPVLWRPLHEMNEGWSWWGGRPGANGSRRLFQITQDHLVGGQGLTNLVAVWNVKDVNTGSIGEYWPGASYVDVASLDVWAKMAPSSADYQAMLSVAGGRPIALGEVGQVPSVALLQSQPRWTWFMVWAEYLKNPSYNNDTAVQNTYWHSRVLVRGEVALPGS
ncbi:MAG: glycosyl hydrolase [Kibdelosporangium sp.]